MNPPPADGHSDRPNGSVPAHATLPSAVRTLPPPAWSHLDDGPLSVASLALEQGEANRPIERRGGPPAILCGLEARLYQARAGGDGDQERQAALDLARGLAARGTELDTAIKLARRALLIRDEAQVREELAEWLLALGEPHLAAATLRRPLDAPEQRGAPERALLRRAADLFAFAGDVAAARDTLSEAQQRFGDDPELYERMAALGDIDREIVPRERAAGLYLQASRLREAAGDRLGAFEALARAFEAARGSASAGELLATALETRGRKGAADEVRRLQASAAPAGATEMHLDRCRQSYFEGDLPAALVAALDARWDATIDLERAMSTGGGGPPGSGPSSFDDLLEQTGQHEWLAARLEVAAAGVEPAARARAELALGGLYASRLASPERAAESYLQALGLDPGCSEAREWLRRHAALSGDAEPLVEALIRGALGERGALAERTDCLWELVFVADERLRDPALARWALGRLSRLHTSEEVADALARNQPAAAAADAVLQDARRALAQIPSGGQRVPLLGQLSTLLSGRPDNVEEYANVLSELVELDPGGGHLLRLERALFREERYEALEPLYAAAATGADAAASRARRALALLRVRRGDLGAAVSALASAVTDRSPSRAELALAATLSALAGDQRSHARALSALAVPLEAALRARLAAFAAEQLLACGEIDGALDAAELACRADPSSVRAVAARAAVAEAGHGDRIAALERGVALLPPRASLCEALADAYGQAGDALLAIAWTQRFIALRPGSLDGVRQLLARAASLSDAGRLADVLGWTFSQALPLAPLVPRIAAVLRRLRELDVERAAAVGRRALDVFGPRSAELRDEILALSAAARQPGLAIAWCERRLAVSDPGEQPALALEVSRRRREAGDVDGASRALLRGLREGAEVSSVGAELERLPAPRSSDGVIAQLIVGAELHHRLGAPAEQAARRYRELGAALWDLASDPESAMIAWQRAAELDPEHGLERFSADLVGFAGPEQASRRLQALCDQVEDAQQVARLLAMAAVVALQAGQTARALSLSRRALELDAGRTDALAVAERSASDADADVLDGIYRGLADAALGTYGVRAAHYRAARQFERRDDTARAVPHAIAAFEAVPGEGVTFVLASRLAQRAGRTSELIAAIERVASVCASGAERAEWLRRAATLADGSTEGLRQRVDVLLRALALRPDGETMQALTNALARLMELAPEEADIQQVRFERALEALLPTLSGPNGARLAITAAGAGLSAFESPRLALEALNAAIACDASVDEYATLQALIPRLANEPAAARALIERSVQLSRQGSAPLGRGLLELGARLAQEFGEDGARAELLVAAARLEPEDVDLVERAQRAAWSSGDAELMSQLLDAVPSGDRVSGLVEVARAAQERGDFEAAIEMLERARETEDTDGERRRGVIDQLREVYQSIGRHEQVEQLLSSEVERADLDEQRRVSLTRDLAALLSARGRAPEALAVVLDAIARRPGDVSLLADAAELAREAGDADARRRVLAQLLDRSPLDEHKLSILRELAPLLEDLRERDEALLRYEQLLTLDPTDLNALSAVERDVEERGDYQKLVELLGRRAALASRVEDVRRIRLRRAMVLEQRLGRAPEAREELEHLLGATGDHLSVLRVLADLNERLDDHRRAAPLWLRASGASRDRSEAAELSERACRAYLRAGDTDAARQVLDSLEAWAPSARLLELKVDIERHGGEPLNLAAALEELALGGDHMPERRAHLLVEAAQCWLSGGDPDSALSCARQAAELEPRSASVQVLKHWLLALQRGGPPERDEAAAVVGELRGATGSLQPEQQELASFLLAEALAASASEDTAREELERARERHGARPLIALGLAERWSGEPERALDAFDLALGGDLRGLREPGAVALAAARAAAAAHKVERALGYLEIAAAKPKTREAALRLQAELREAADIPPARSGSVPPPDVQRRAPAPPAARPSPPAAPALAASDGGLRAGAAQRPSADEPARPSSSSRIAVAEPVRITNAFMAADAVEEMLSEALENGNVEAARELITRLERDPARTRDLLAVCRRLVLLEPGDEWALEKLYAAAVADRNPVYAQALEHVLRAFRPGAAPVLAPALSELPDDPERVRSMLFRDVHGTAAEALALVWEGAEHVFRRDPGSYGVTGLERVAHGAHTPLATAYTAASRALGLLRTALFQRRSAGSVTLNVALLSPPAIILSGDVRADTAELRFHLGAMLAAAMSERVLMFGSPESQVRTVLAALGLAFGPPGQSRPNLTGAAHLAEVLWEAIPARSQRRLAELCEQPDATDYDLASSRAYLATRRAGLFVCGDLPTAVREIASEAAMDPSALADLGGLKAACAENEAIADLVCLATSAEYAEARWQPLRTGPRQPSGTWKAAVGK